MSVCVMLSPTNHVVLCMTWTDTNKPSQLWHEEIVTNEFENLLNHDVN